MYVCKFWIAWVENKWRVLCKLNLLFNDAVLIKMQIQINLQVDQNGYGFF